jgi:hypothetical protein
MRRHGAVISRSRMLRPVRFRRQWFGLFELSEASYSAKELRHVILRESLTLLAPPKGFSALAALRP